MSNPIVGCTQRWRRLPPGDLERTRRRKASERDRLYKRNISLLRGFLETEVRPQEVAAPDAAYLFRFLEAFEGNRGKRDRFARSS